VCGLFGWVSPSSPDSEEIARAIEGCFSSMRYRGPDDRGVVAFDGKASRWNQSAPFHVANILLGHLRLSILDLSSRGHQPMVSPDGRFRVAYNGEVYNYRELKKELALEGVSFITDSDTEVVLHALIHWGISALNRFVGMFAISFYDDVENRLLLIRDHFGIKPLYYTKTQDGLIGFASEIPALLSMPGVARKLNAQRVYDYLLFGDYDSNEESIIKDVFQLQPGSYIAIDCANASVVESKSYWTPELQPLQKLTFVDAAEQLRAMFLDHIRLHLRSDVPLGAALSGGVDSSAVVASIRHLYPDFEIKTFTYVAPGSSINEEAWADCVIGATGAESFKVAVSPSEMISDLDDLILSQGEPFGSSSIYAQYRVFKLAKESGVKVTLDGQGADELFAGYYGYPGERLKSLLVEGRLLEAWRFFHATSKWPDRNKAMVFKRLLAMIAPDQIYPLLWAAEKGSLTPEWLVHDWFKQRGVRFVPAVGENVCEGRRYVHMQLAKQLTRKGVPGLLRHGDRNSMRFSIESRVPFLTREMAEFVLTLPEQYLIAADGTTKAVFKEAMRGIVPKRVLDRKDKIGFSTPEREWLQELSPWINVVFDDAMDVPLFYSGAMKQTWEEILCGKRDFSCQVWRWVNFLRWAQLLQIEYE